MSEVREAVRSRYQGAARQLTVLADTGAELDAGCCRADGPDCGCGGAYSSDELAGVGLTDAVSLGCGNPLLLAQLQPGDSVLDLGSGGGLAVPDVVELKELPPDVKKAVDAWAGCISGTIPVASYRRLLVEAGFEEPTIEITQEQDVEGVGGAIASAAVRGRKPAPS